MNEQLQSIGYCGLYCGLCAGRSRIPRRATALQQALADEGWDLWGQGIPGFPEFWQFLGGLADEGGCPGCRVGGGNPECPIRVCARERGFDLCVHCPDFACEHIEPLAARYPTLMADSQRLRAVGLARWLDEQEERARRGVVYADIRYNVEQNE